MYKYSIMHHGGKVLNVQKSRIAQMLKCKQRKIRVLLKERKILYTTLKSLKEENSSIKFKNIELARNLEEVKQFNKFLLTIKLEMESVYQELLVKYRNVKNDCRVLYQKLKSVDVLRNEALDNLVKLSDVVRVLTISTQESLREMMQYDEVPTVLQTTNANQVVSESVSRTTFSATDSSRPNCNQRCSNNLYAFRERNIFNNINIPSPVEEEAPEDIVNEAISRGSKRKQGILGRFRGTRLIKDNIHTEVENICSSQESEAVSNINVKMQLRSSLRLNAVLLDNQDEETADIYRKVNLKRGKNNFDRNVNNNNNLDVPYHEVSDDDNGSEGKLCLTSPAFLSPRSSDNINKRESEKCDSTFLISAQPSRMSLVTTSTVANVKIDEGYTDDEVTPSSAENESDKRMHRDDFVANISSTSHSDSNECVRVNKRKNVKQNNSSSVRRISTRTAFCNDVNGIIDGENVVNKENIDNSISDQNLSRNCHKNSSKPETEIVWRKSNIKIFGINDDNTDRALPSEDSILNAASTNKITKRKRKSCKSLSESEQLSLRKSAENSETNGKIINDSKNTICSNDSVEISQSRPKRATAVNKHYQEPKLKTKMRR